ncbi:type II secretion system protein GspI [Litorimonas cladophorae]|uniref:Type II secretion system protein I n=1 Tax=Litorimonas cladophorae TaxID=1220491 RepID=A0A918NI60_9PROT|nr:type II secretion system minor pseudopilin GspI [Litorimonas cladophorae]GGX69282.1 type II secretion system protein GspI [Litorimonas cladophorae]
MKDSGFTLVEVMAALVIFSVAIVGLSHVGTQSVSHSQRLADKTFAGVVADNQLIRARMQRPQVGTKSGEEAAGGQTYRWRILTAETPQAGLLELQVQVSQSEDVLITRRAWLSQGGNATTVQQ